MLQQFKTSISVELHSTHYKIKSHLIQELRLKFARSMLTFLLTKEQWIGKKKWFLSRTVFFVGFVCCWCVVLQSFYVFLPKILCFLTFFWFGQAFCVFQLNFLFTKAFMFFYPKLFFSELFVLQMFFKLNFFCLTR